MLIIINTLLQRNLIIQMDTISSQKVSLVFITTLVDTYEELIDHQVVYGELDSKDWDFVDSDIFNTLQSRNQLPYNPDPDSGNLPDGVKATAQINQYYKEHHYMVPVLNNVVVLIKAVTK